MSRREGEVAPSCPLGFLWVGVSGRGLTLFFARPEMKVSEVPSSLTQVLCTP